MRRKTTLKDWGYPAEGIIDVDDGGGDSHELPQEALSERTCAYCRKFNKEEWVCTVTGEDKNPDCDYCDNIDYIEEWLDTEDGFRTPVRSEYSSDKTFQQACKAIKAINHQIWLDREPE